MRLVNAPIKNPVLGSGCGVVDNHGHTETEGGACDEAAMSRITKGQCSIQFSEIIFDNHHHRAVVWAGTSCGPIGGTLVFRHVGNGWTLLDACPTGLP